MKKWTLPIVIALIVLFVLVVAHMADSQNTVGETKSFNVSSGSYKLSEVIKDIKTLPSYDGYDVETVKWMESLGNKQVFFENGSIIIMNGFDGEKLHQNVGMTDVYIYHHFTADVIESHELGYKHPTVYYVKNVNYTGQEIVDADLA